MWFIPRSRWRGAERGAHAKAQRMEACRAYEQLLSGNVEQIREGLVFKAYTLLYHSSSRNVGWRGAHAKAQRMDAWSGTLSISATSAFPSTPTIAVIPC